LNIFRKVLELSPSDKLLGLEHLAGIIPKKIELGYEKSKTFLFDSNLSKILIFSEDSEFEFWKLVFRRIHKLTFSSRN